MNHQRQRRGSKRRKKGLPSSSESLQQSNLNNSNEPGEIDGQFSPEECPFCGEVFRDPVGLPGCGHPLCRHCLEMLLNFQQLQSPVTQGGTQSTLFKVHCCTCNKVSLVAAASDLPSNAPLKEASDSLRNERTKNLCCNDCGSPATLHCELCSQLFGVVINLCEGCWSVFHSNKLTRDHPKARMEESYGPAGQSLGKKCHIHTHQKLQWYCRQDKELVCQLCTLVGPHKGHDVIVLEDELETRKKELEEGSSKVNVISRKVVEALGSIRTVREEVENIHTAFEMDISCTAKQLKDAIDKRVLALSEQSKTVKEAKMRALQQQENRLMETEKACSELYKLIDQLLKRHGKNSCALMIFSQGIASQLPNSLLMAESSLSPCVTSQVLAHSKRNMEEVLAAIHKFGAFGVQADSEDASPIQ